MEPKINNTARVAKGFYCKTCGWPIIHACCNDGMAEQEPYCHSDYWAYCSNKTCVNHAGEDWSLMTPDFFNQ